MVKKIFQGVGIFLPLVVGIIVSIVIHSTELDYPTPKTVSGVITEYFNGRNSKYVHEPKHVIIDGKKYIVSYVIDWALDTDDIKNNLAVGTEVELKYYEEDDCNYVVAIKVDGEYLLTLDDYEVAYYERRAYNVVISTSLGYTMSLIILLLVLLIDLFDYTFDVEFNNKLFLNKLQLIGLISLCVLSFILSIVIASIVNNWLYMVGITITALLVYGTFKMVNILKFGVGGFNFIILGKKKRYHYNGIRDIIDLGNNRLVISFNKTVELSTDRNELLNIIKNNNDIYMIKFNNRLINELNIYLKRYYYKNKKK